MMPRVRNFNLLLLPLLAAGVQAQDGGKLYGLYCSPCHAEDGKGAPGGIFPPLDGSNWIDQDPGRAIKTVLHGLKGPIEVNGKAYNLEMPPQGQVLDDNQIAAILTYVHTAWGNEGKAVPPGEVKAVRENTADRTAPWTSPELLKLHPLTARETPLKNLIFRVYKGQWKDLPDFDKLQPESVEEEHDGIINVGHSPFTDHFGIVWKADFIAPEDGEYTFTLDADDGAKVLINGNVLAQVHGVGPMGSTRAEDGRVTLKRGKNALRVDYFDATGHQDISLRWKGPGVEDWRWLSAQPAKSKQSSPTISLHSQEEKTVIYRNFMKGTTARAIGFGFPGGLNLVYSADHLAPELIWTGGFMEVSRHWTNSSEGSQAPAENDVTRLTSTKFLPDAARFKGYKLDSAGNPTFTVQIATQTLTDSWKPGAGRSLKRTLTLSGEGSSVEIPVHEKDLPKELTVSARSISLSPGTESIITYQWR